MPNIKPFILLLLSVLAAGQAVALQDIYPKPAEAKGDIATALQVARTSHRRIIVDFGGNWCTDCHVLDFYFHDETNAPLLEENFVLVHVNVGRTDQNIDIAKSYQIPVDKGVPALAVLDIDGKLLFSQKAGEFKAMRGMQSQAVTAFLTEWKPAPRQ
jgi:thioredoxin 1